LYKTAQHQTTGYFSFTINCYLFLDGNQNGVGNVTVTNGSPHNGTNGHSNGTHHNGGNHIQN